MGLQSGLLHLILKCDAQQQEQRTQNTHAAQRGLGELAVPLFIIRGGLPNVYGTACAAALRVQTCALPEALQGVQLSMSPGRFLAAGGGVLVCRVVAVKPGPVAVLDVSAAQCLRLEKRGAYHEAAALRTAGRPPLLQQLTTLEQGAPFARQVLPQLRVGDPVVIRMLGADGRSFSCASERCPAYLLRADGTIEPIE